MPPDLSGDRGSPLEDAGERGKKILFVLKKRPGSLAPNSRHLYNAWLGR